METCRGVSDGIRPMKFGTGNKAKSLGVPAALLVLCSLTAFLSHCGSSHLVLFAADEFLTNLKLDMCDEPRDRDAAASQAFQALTTCTTSSSATTWPRPTRCGTCFALAPQTSAYLNVSFSVR